MGKYDRDNNYNDNYNDPNYMRQDNNFDRMYDARQYSQGRARDEYDYRTNQYQPPTRNGREYNDPSRPYNDYRQIPESQPRYNSQPNCYPNNNSRYGEQPTNYQGYQQPQPRQPYYQSPQQRDFVPPRPSYTPMDNNSQYTKPQPYTNNAQPNIPPQIRQDLKEKNVGDFKLCHPKSKQDVSNLIDCLKKKQTLLVSIEKLDQERATRFLDFLSGAIYALEGSCQQVGNGLFLFAPNGMSISRSQNLNGDGEESK